MTKLQVSDKIANSLLEKHGIDINEVSTLKSKVKSACFDTIMINDPICFQLLTAQGYDQDYVRMRSLKKIRPDDQYDVILMVRTDGNSKVLSYYKTAVLKNFKPDKNPAISVTPVKADNSNKSSRKRSDKNLSLVEIAESVTATEADKRDERIDRLEKKFDDLIAVLMAQKLDGK